MSNKQYKRITIILGVLLIIFLAGTAIKIFFSSEVKDDELAAVKASTDEIGEVTAKNIFSPDNKTDDDLVQYKNPRANMILSLPSTWKINWNSDREITAISGKASKIPDTSFFVLYDFGAQNVESGKDLIDTFKNQLYKKTYTINGDKYSFFTYEDPEMNTDTIFTNKHDNLVACAVTKNIRMCHKSATGSSEKGFTKIDYYINWYGKPCVISCVVKNKDVNTAKDYFHTIASNIKYCEQKKPAVGKTASLPNEFNMQIKLPHQFQLAMAEDDYMVYRSEINNGSAYSGMSLLRLTYSGEDAIEINEDTIMKDYALSWFKGSFSDSTSITPVFYAEETGSCEIGKYNAIVYDVDYTIVAKRKDYPSYFIPGETWKMKVFALIGENECEYIILNYQECQEKEMKEIIKLFADFDV